LPPGSANLIRREQTLICAAGSLASTIEKTIGNTIESGKGLIWVNQTRSILLANFGIWPFDNIARLA
jgi:hypothetical protein